MRRHSLLTQDPSKEYQMAKSFLPFILSNPSPEMAKYIEGLRERIEQEHINEKDNPKHQHILIGGEWARIHYGIFAMLEYCFVNHKTFLPFQELKTAVDALESPHKEHSSYLKNIQYSYQYVMKKLKRREDEQLHNTPNFTQMLTPELLHEMVTEMEDNMETD